MMAKKTGKRGSSSSQLETQYETYTGFRLPHQWYQNRQTKNASNVGDVLQPPNSENGKHVAYRLFDKYRQGKLLKSDQLEEAMSSNLNAKEEKREEESATIQNNNSNDRPQLVEEMKINERAQIDGKQSEPCWGMATVQKIDETLARLEVPEAETQSCHLELPVSNYHLYQTQVGEHVQALTCMTRLFLDGELQDAQANYQELTQSVDELRQETWEDQQIYRNFDQLHTLLWREIRNQEYRIGCLELQNQRLHQIVEEHSKKIESVPVPDHGAMKFAAYFQSANQLEQQIKMMSMQVQDKHEDPQQARLQQLVTTDMHYIHQLLTEAEQLLHRVRSRVK